MAFSINEVTVQGRVGKDPEIRQVGSGRVASLRLACSESYKDKASGEWKDKTEWIPITVWDERSVDAIEKHVRKGTSIWVRGRFETRSYKSNNDEKETYVTECVVRSFSGKIMIDYQKKSEGSSESFSRSEPSARRPVASKNNNSKNYDLDDSIPF